MSNPRQELFERIKLQGEPNFSHTLDNSVEFSNCLTELGNQLNKLAGYEEAEKEKTEQDG
jgi:hypothetical protein